MALVKFISGDGVEHEVEETSLAAGVMRENGFMVISIDGERQPISAIEPETVFTEEDAVAQNDGEDVAAEGSTTPAAEPATPPNQGGEPEKDAPKKAAATKKK